MKIALFTDIFLEVTGGIPVAIKAQKKALERAGHEVTLFCPAGKQCDEEEKEGVILVPIRFFKVNGAPVSVKVEKILSFLEEQIDFTTFDLIHVHYEMGCSQAGMELAKKHKIPLVATMHGREDMVLDANIPFGLKNFVGVILNLLHGRRIKHKIKAKQILALNLDFVGSLAKARMWELIINHLAFADIALTPSEHFAKKVQTIFTAFKIKTPVVGVPNGVEERLTAEKVDVRKFDGKRPLRMIWNSRVSKEKRIMVVLMAILELQKITEEVASEKQIQPNKKLLEMTVFGDGNELEKAKKFTEKHNLPVIFYGKHPRERIFEELKKSDLSVMASYQVDTQGMNLVEAQALGLPVIFADDDMREVITSGGGLLTKSPDSQGFLRGILEILTNPDQIEKMSKAMIVHRENTSVEKRCEKLLEVYKLAIVNGVRKIS